MEIIAKTGRSHSFFLKNQAIHYGTLLYNRLIAKKTLKKNVPA